ncbi:golgin subfamily A member 6-like protein 7 [Centropristis striata]|uniref:golgin subfamily A member 6-like protein 7 n=1 Tax=Centropristis striata TaxID=184440 RepID=UPI0027DF73A2|nr:golgin subfamily A member 6-like protein 7 [Centropristis striata]
MGGQKRKYKHEASPPAEDDEVLGLKKALQSATKNNQNLASINTNLRKQVKEFTHRENSWVVEKLKFAKKNEITRTILCRKYAHAQDEIMRLEEELKAAETDKALMMKENENAWDDLEKMASRGEEIASQLKEMHDKCQEQQKEMKKKEEMIDSFRREMMDLLKEFTHTDEEQTQPEVQENQKKRPRRSARNIYGFHESSRIGIASI